MGEQSGERGHFVGVDTGGTFTDAAVISATDHRVVATAKALTTKGDLAIGVTDAIAAAVSRLPHELSPARIGLVSVSTTLATNAVVEGHGDDVGLVLIGFDAAMAKRTGVAAAFPALPIATIGGGHDHSGRELTPLDEEALRVAVASMGERPRAFAVSATFATRNPAHEHRAAEVISELTGRPVTASSELSSGLDAPRRALTAVLNARLIGRVTGLVDAVRRSMAELGIVGPLMLVKGDGSLALAETVAVRPIETVLSGPAASLVGARWLSGLDDFLLADMGGTTTDLGLVSGGRPKVADHGAEVGGWRTMVRAIDVRTIGLGGDSMVVVEGDAVSLRPERVVPLALAAHAAPELLALLENDLADARTGGALHGRFLMRPLGTTSATRSGGLSAREAELLEALGERPRPVRELAASARSMGVVDALRRKGLVQLVAFTPSDAAHVLGLQATWSKPAAVLGAKLGARLLEMRNPTDERAWAFARTVWDITVTRSARAVLDTALGRGPGDELGPASASAPVPSRLLDAVCAGLPQIGAARVSVTPVVPIIAVGGPVKVFYDEVGRRLGSPVEFPEHCEVANAVGAATGAIVRSVTIEVHGDGGGGFRVHTPSGVQHVTGAATAIELAEATAVDTARTAVEEMGGRDPEVRVSSTERIHLPGREDDSGVLLVVVVAEAVGRPATLGDRRG